MSSLLPPFFATLPAALAPPFDPAAPWLLLGEPLDQRLAALPAQAIEIDLPSGVHLLGEGIAIGAGTRIDPGAVIEGPIEIGRDVQIRTGAYLRGGSWIGDGCLIGAHTEIKRAILLPGAKAPHQNYVGDSILGVDVNLGAGTILSNFRHDGQVIAIPDGNQRLPTGRRKLGAVLGDNVLTGCNTVLHPGVLIGRDSQVYPGVQLRSGVYPANSIIKLRQQLEVIERQG